MNRTCVKLSVSHRLKMAAQVFQASETFAAGLTGIRTLTCVTAEMTLQVCLPLYCVRAEWTFVAHRGSGI